jgi:hypothetical protein
LVYYLYGAAQAVALAARTSSTSFDPCSLDLPSIGALVGFYHACLGFPVKQTWLDAIKAGNCNTLLQADLTMVLAGSLSHLKMARLAKS